MKPRLSERALRRAVAELSELDPGDLEGVLDRLDDDDRATIAAMLATVETRPVPDPARALRYDPAPAFSDWLRALLDNEPGAMQLTPTALRALRTAAERQGWAPSTAPHLAPKGMGALFGSWRSK